MPHFYKPYKIYNLNISSFSSTINLPAELSLNFTIWCHIMLRLELYGTPENLVGVLGKNMWAGAPQMLPNTGVTFSAQKPLSCCLQMIQGLTFLLNWCLPSGEPLVLLKVHSALSISSFRKNIAFRQLSSRRRKLILNLWTWWLFWATFSFTHNSSFQVLR